MKLLAELAEWECKAADNVSCSNRNAIYALICCKCEKTVYLCETERMLKEGVDERLLDVLQQAENPIMRHFEGCKEEHVKLPSYKEHFMKLAYADS